ncbi:response regulator transcription factor [Streptomyces sp. HNM0663]|uniref:Response regulator transcription factor n=1 Tax=Streptomyces chengmaiensis TaxID=3040919 RepID=A0ABT6HF95_9ACTN|nr:response regulator transcription factor [Streptomyces chengmaiensis]MDH2387433.1 response regulator transcription factor [Streptomyces chengmaiensis]
MCGGAKQPAAAFAENVERINMALSAVQSALDAQERMIECLLGDTVVVPASAAPPAGASTRAARPADVAPNATPDVAPDVTPGLAAEQGPAAGQSRPPAPVLDSGCRQALALLTPREREVLVLVAQGKSNRQVANSLGISEKTVKNHLSALFSKIGAADRTQAVVFGIRGGVVAISDGPGIVLPFSAPEERAEPPGPSA